MSEFEPELGQALFGQSPQTYKCDEFFIVALGSIAANLEHMFWTKHKKDNMSPFENNGMAFKCKEFGVWAYDWSVIYNDIGEQPYNFFHPKTGIKVSWYKYFARSISCNKKPTKEEIIVMTKDCIDAIRAYYDKEGYEYGGIKEVAYFSE